ncbi:MAG: InlB B-repeat-containing protein [Treponema sp.]|nr:InlB B-repeat-containing protein [Treponema sp.]MBR4628863.1 InlB B-repeat-containing protein [Treponema sp.]MBR6912312.1 InlB B-repeat-containing protein [Treponema sp.]
MRTKILRFTGIFLITFFLAISCSSDDTESVTTSDSTPEESSDELNNTQTSVDTAEKETSQSSKTSDDDSKNNSNEEQNSQKLPENEINADSEVQFSKQNYTITFLTTNEESSAKSLTQTGTAMQTTLLQSAESLGIVAPVGKAFIGWTTEKNSNAVQYKDGAPIFLDADTTLYAIYHTYSTGDIILANGEIISVESISEYKITENNPPIAVIAFIGDKTVPAEEKSGTALGIGLKHGKKRRWFNGSLRIMYPNFPKIFCWAKNGYQTDYSLGVYSEFASDCDGSDNWETLRTTYNQDEREFPVFQYANHYSEIGDINVQKTQFENGWYVPSIAELAYIYRNKATIDLSIEKVNGELLGEGYYFSSSQDSWSNVYYANVNDFAYLASFRDGRYKTPDSSGFTDSNDVIVLRVFH